MCRSLYLVAILMSEAKVLREVEALNVVVFYRYGVRT